MFCRQQVVQPTILNLNSVVESMGTMLKQVTGRGITLKTNLGCCLGEAIFK